jgi:hypothetical protein
MERQIAGSEIYNSLYMALLTFSNLYPCCIALYPEFTQNVNGDSVVISFSKVEDLIIPAYLL